MARLLILILALIAGPVCAQSRTDSPFDGWAAAVIAADWRDGYGQPIQAFDNARRDLTTGFLRAGFSRADMVDYTLRPDAKPVTTARDAVAGMAQAAQRATRGCLIYITSHGSPEGVVFGPDATLNPTGMANLLRGWCGERPTVVIVSACFSGVFVDGLAAPNRMILTAARRDRSSFGCAAGITHPYFDGCIIQALPTATDFIALAHAARTCVAWREIEEGLTPPSEPQLSIGSQMQLLLPTLRFLRPAR